MMIVDSIALVLVTLFLVEVDHRSLARGLLGSKRKNEKMFQSAEVMQGKEERTIELNLNININGVDGRKHVSGRQLKADKEKDDAGCYYYNIDDCKYDISKIIEETNGISMETCQLMCENSYANCTFFIYEKTRRKCKFLNMAMDDYVRTCLRFAAPVSSPVKKCLSCISMPKGSGLKPIARPDDCKFNHGSKCNYLGNPLGSWNDIKSAEDCQKICKFHDECEYWKFDKMENTCELLDSKDDNCDVNVGLPRPSREEY